MSLLGHLAPRFASGEEPLATQALAYILSEAPEAAQALVDVVGQTGLEPFEPGGVRAEEALGPGQPDLTIRDDEGRIRIVIENKFWAALTEAQPVSYLEWMPTALPSALVFVVPHTRQHSLWGELKAKCARSGIELGGESQLDDICWARAGRKVLAVTSWVHVLQALHATVDSAEIQQDIIQLHGLTNRMNTAEFLPLREEETGDVRVARRLVNYLDLVEEIVKRLETDGAAKRQGASKSSYATGRWVLLHGRFSTWLGVDWQAWGYWGVTPFWSEHYVEGPNCGFQRQMRKARELFADSQEYNNGYLCVPIHLQSGVERARVVDDAVRQVRAIADKLREAFPVVPDVGEPVAAAAEAPSE